MSTQHRMVHLAYKVALDPTPAQARAFASHAGGARFAYNWGVATVKNALDTREEERARDGEPSTPVPGHFDLCKAWVVHKDTAEWTDRTTGETTTGIPWVGNNFSGTYQSALRDADRAWRGYFDSRTGQRAGRPLGKPRFKSKRDPARFSVHGDALRLNSATRVNLPRIGAVRVMSDDSRHPAIARSRKRTPGQRHMGNRRRARMLWTQLQNGTRLAAKAREILAAAHQATPEDNQALDILNQLADERARASAVDKATLRLAKADKALIKAQDEADSARDATAAQAGKAAEKLDKARARRDKAAELLNSAQAITANRISGWSRSKLDQAVATGQVDPTSAADLARAYQLTSAESDLLAQAALQPRIVRATISKGADGLWWASLGCEIPVQERTTPTRRQTERGAVGIDLGVRSIATLSQRAGGSRDIANPTYLEKAQNELRRAHQDLSRRQKGSAGHAKAKARVGLIHADVARLRQDHLHRASTRITRTFAAIGIEGHDMQMLAQDRGEGIPRRVRRNRNRALADASAGALRDQIKMKSSRSGSTVVDLGQGVPTGRTCAACGSVRAKPVPAWHERFACDECGRTLPRRVNSARLVEKAAVGSGPPDGGPAQSRGGGVSPDRPSGAGGQPLEKRAARTGPLGPGQTGTPGP